MNNFTSDIILGMMLLIGIFGFISGEFIVSTVLFGSAAIYSNVRFTQRLDKKKDIWFAEE